MLTSSKLRREAAEPKCRIVPPPPSSENDSPKLKRVDWSLLSFSHIWTPVIRVDVASVSLERRNNDLLVGVPSTRSSYTQESRLFELGPLGPTCLIELPEWIIGLEGVVGCGSKTSAFLGLESVAGQGMSGDSFTGEFRFELESGEFAKRVGLAGGLGEGGGVVVIGGVLLAFGDEVEDDAGAVPTIIGDLGGWLLAFGEGAFKEALL